MKNDEKIDIQFTEELSENMSMQEKVKKHYETGHRYLEISKYMKKFEDRDKYFHRGILYIKKCLPYLNVKKELRSLRLQLFKERAENRIAIYEQADAVLKSAKTSIDYNTAYSLFERLYLHEKNHSVPEKLVDPQLYKRLMECSDSQEKMKYCEQQAAKKDAESKHKTRAVSLCILVLLAGLVIFSRTSTFHQCVGAAAASLKYYDFAYNQYMEAYEETGDTHAKQDALECLYKDAEETAESGKIKAAINKYNQLVQEDYEGSEDRLYELEIQNLTDCKAGDVVSFGNKGQMKWRVLEVREDRVLLLKKYSLDDSPRQPFNTSETATTWETSSLRQWLNEDYLKEKFSDQEQAAILETEVTAEDNPRYHTDAGKDTKDRLFLLSISEYNTYSSLLKKTASSWWLRTPGNSSSTMSFVNRYKSVMDYGYEVTTTHISVKPAMWVSIS